MKRTWNEKTALHYIDQVSKNEMVKGLKYWSAVDYLVNHKNYPFQIFA